FFCLTVEIAMVTSSHWTGVSAFPRLRVSASVLTWTPAAIFLILTMGAAWRNKRFAIVPHLIPARVLMRRGMAMVAPCRTGPAEQRAVVRPFVPLATLLALHLFVGGGSNWLRERTRAPAQPLPVMVSTTAAHVATGALMLATRGWVGLGSTEVPAPPRLRVS